MHHGNPEKERSICYGQWSIINVTYVNILDAQLTVQGMSKTIQYVMKPIRIPMIPESSSLTEFAEIDIVSVRRARPNRTGSDKGRSFVI